MYEMNLPAGVLRHAHPCGANRPLQLSLEAIDRPTELDSATAT